MSQPSIRLGLVGLGKIACDQHLPAIAGNSRFELVAVADPVHRLDGVRGYAGLAEMLAGEAGSLDAVALCTPPAVRVSLAREAIAAGLDVLLEKPPAAAPTQAEALAQLATRAGVTLYAAWHSRESEAVEAARAWLANRSITAVHITWREDVRQWHPGQDWLLAKGGFGVFDPAINAFSILTEILPSGICVEGAQLEMPANRQSPTDAQVQMRCSTGAPIIADLSILHPGDQQWDIVVHTADGELVLRQGGHRLEIDGALRLDASNDEYPRIYRRFADLIDRRASSADASPLALVADALLLGTVTTGPDFEF
ncbi:MULTISPECIES: Gfo/Idh/MocA family oxidoreductase [unclassified Novosphingobium]|uniref:Gfo/Idh/MocA family protein n=1 Tax=unclassified Novosphingobium TaxID=2644732 RepID=UPI00146D7AAB|nr:MULTISPECIES: Gfo/Idh/MocA family oxidoreductase [unclassified Novosphingobium]NMN06687.1 D-galactose 1-dehydrogenase/L-arabinose 1- dehydrogenase [Novosphingobium sp. SG919]NMN88862.1 D-galactose 1-dehydrogenase/L-arabinose 1- dehydrogenase [Novosphingobium sp. SG916]